MRQALESALNGRNIKRNAINPRAAEIFHFVAAAAVPFAHFPFGIIGRRGNDADLMTPRSQPFSRFSLELTDARPFGRIVQGNEKNLHTKNTFEHL